MSAGRWFAMSLEAAGVVWALLVLWTAQAPGWRRRRGRGSVTDVSADRWVGMEASA